MPITQRQVFIALNTPGGPVYEFRDTIMNNAMARARIKSPRNNRLNALHRGGVTGTYKAAWRSQRFGNQNGAGLRMGNYSDHAVYVERGRRVSFKYQRFSWKNWTRKGRPGQIRYIGLPPAGMNEQRLAWWIGLDDDERAKLPASAQTPWGGRKTAARRGRHVLRLAINYATKPYGLAPI